MSSVHCVNPTDERQINERVTHARYHNLFMTRAFVKVVYCREGYHAHKLQAELTLTASAKYMGKILVELRRVHSSPRLV